VVPVVSRGVFAGGLLTGFLRQVAANHETPNGNNERIRTAWFDPASAAALTRALDALLGDL